jgi:hypothetical protein
MSGIIRANNTGQSGLVSNIETIDSDDYVDASIDNAHLADDAVDTDEIADDAVTLAKMEGGTDGNLITYDTSGNPAFVATGSDGQVLTSAGADNPPAFETLSAPTEASQANMEDEDTGTLYVPPDLLKHSPGVAKIWCNWEMTGAHARVVSYNYTSVTDNGLGITDHVIATDFSSGNYVLAFGGVDAPVIFLAGGVQAAGIFKTLIENGQDGTRLDSTAAQLVGFGDQA